MWKNLIAFFLAFAIGHTLSYAFQSLASESVPVELVSGPATETLSDLPGKSVAEPIKGRFFKATSKSDQEVIDFFHRFQQAVEVGDKKAVGSLILFPVCVRFAYGDSERKGCRELNRRSFLRNYDKIFDRDYRQFILDIRTDRYGQLGVLWANWRGVTADRGQFWFEGICRDRSCSQSELKFTTLSSGLLQRPYDRNNHID